MGKTGTHCEFRRRMVCSTGQGAQRVVGIGSVRVTVVYTYKQTVLLPMSTSSISNYSVQPPIESEN